jgi:hypothetical protein
LDLPADVADGRAALGNRRNILRNAVLFIDFRVVCSSIATRAARRAGTTNSYRLPGTFKSDGN